MKLAAAALIGATLARSLSAQSVHDPAASQGLSGIPELMLNGSAGAASVYWRRVEQWSARTAADVAASLTGIATASELQRIRAATSVTGPLEVRKFWARRAINAGMSPDDRIVEHYRRLETIRTRYTVPESRGAPPRAAVIRDNTLRAALGVDDRGIVYLKHGEPAHILKSPAGIFAVNETWVYPRGASEYEVFHFMLPPGRSGFVLVTDPFAYLEAVDPEMLRFASGRAWGALATDDLIHFFQEHAKYYARSGLIAARLSHLQLIAKFNTKESRQRLEDAANDVRIASIQMGTDLRRSNTLALATDSHTKHFKRNIPLFAQSVAFKGNGCAEVLYAFGIPLQSVRSETASDHYDFHFSVSVLDTLSGDVLHFDTTVTLVMRPIQGLARVAKTMCPAHAQQLVSIATVRAEHNPEAGGTIRMTHAVPQLAGPGLQMSDLLMAGLGSGNYQRRGRTIDLVPPQQFAQGGAARVYYELYAPPAGRKLRTEIGIRSTEAENRIAQLFLKRKGSAARLTFEEEIESPEARLEMREIRPGLPVGEYELEVKVTDVATRTEVVRRQRFRVVN